MLRHRTKIALAIVSLLVPAAFDRAEDAKKNDPATEDKQVVDSKATQRPAASAVNFRKELNLPLDSLSTLGSRIESATRKPDPVALGHMANELSVAEKVSGKSATITSKALAKAAAQLASERKEEAELKSMLQITNQTMFAEDDITSMKQSLALAQEQIKSDKRSLERNEEPTSAPRKVVVNNYTTQYLDVYVNGNLKTTVQPGSTQVITIEHRWNPTVLKAYGNEDTNVWGPRYVWGKFEKYTWNIN